MIEANRQYITSDEIDVLEELKKQLHINGVERFAKIVPGPRNIQTNCPFHHEGQERKPSFGISTKDGVCHCFRGDTKVITQNGIFEISDLCDKQVNILNGNGEWETVTFKNYGKMPLMRINLTCNGKYKSIYATDKHEWVIKDRVNKCFTKDLKSWMYLEKVLPRELINTEIDPMGVVHGFCYGDGAKTSNSQVSNHYECIFYNKHDEELIPYFEKAFYPKKLNIRNKLADNGKYYKAVCFSVSKTEDFKLPPQLDKPLSYLLGFLAGYFVADGNSSHGGATIYSHSLCNLKKVRDIAIKCNIASYAIGVSNIPEGQRGCIYVKKSTRGYTLRFVRKTIPENFFITQKGQGSIQIQNGSLRYRVVSVEKTDIVEDVYCCETSTHSFALDDFILTGNCFACGWAGSFAEMVSNVFGYNDGGIYGSKWLIKNFLTVEISNRNDIDLDLSRSKKKELVQYVSDEELDSYRVYHPYMWKRKMTPEVVDIFDIGYDRNTQCLTFPIRDEKGNCLFVARRSVNTKFFHYPNNVAKPVYGLYELRQLIKYPDTIIICESMINAITCWVYGRYAVALNGTGTKSQIEQLKQMPNREFVLALDPDDAGEHGRERLRKGLTNKIVTEYVIPEGKDINDLSKTEFDNLQEIFD